MILDLVAEAVRDGARQARACEVVGVDLRTLERWRLSGAEEDRRRGPRTEPGNKLTPAERARVIEVANAPEHRDLSPKQIVPRLADQGRYLASESTIYRILRQAKLLGHRQRSRPPVARPREHVATAPCQVWSWDITYLRSAVRGRFYYLYLVLDVWSRKIVGWAVHEEESMEHGARLVEAVCCELGLDPQDLVLHADNGGPMKGSTMLATLQRLGIVPSFSRPHTSDDNAYSESLFRTLKYRPEYPSRPFADLDAARAWVAAFVRWYNTEHLHSALRFVSPDDRHSGREDAVLARRRRVYAAARRKHPERWSGSTRNWQPVGAVRLNPDPDGRRDTPKS